jgi:hypothetical protein
MILFYQFYRPNIFLDSGCEDGAARPILFFVEQSVAKNKSVPYYQFVADPDRFVMAKLAIK